MNNTQAVKILPYNSQGSQVMFMPNYRLQIWALIGDTSIHPLKQAVTIVHSTTK